MNYRKLDAMGDAPSIYIAGDSFFVDKAPEVDFCRLSVEWSVFVKVLVMFLTSADQSAKLVRSSNLGRVV
jgi:hypothetical protein